ncbi:hypothetical protein [Sphingomonas sp.]|uniref:hypothetical protein n=1 Tax=Sphingomonas sp. TaxID=28214 RepID=UPI0025F857D1|nr:hypothetical protein [Sphingomonas sp.]MBV9527159.1 hypothetical protein [Sphingomonas sp.]
MPVSEGWHELHRRRFAELPFDCGNDVDPGIVDSPHVRDWSRRKTTDDQQRIESYIDRFDLRDRTLLHVGIGNSGLARRLHKRVKAIVGTTVDDPEIRVAHALGLPNYRAIKHNKYSGSTGIPAETFDFIIDNNPAVPCCCIRHLADLFSLYASRLGSNGQIVTDREGLQWSWPGAHERWSFDFDDIAAIARATGLNAYRVTADIYVLARSAPERPARMPLLRHGLRRFRTLPADLASQFLKRARRAARNMLR